MSCRTSRMAFIWSSVSLNSKASSNSRCNWPSAENAWPSRGLARGIEFEQLVGHVFHGLLHARLGLLPLLRAQPVQRRLHAFRRAVLLDQVEPRERHVEPRALGVLQDHELGGLAIALRDFLQTLVLPDAVLDVHHVVVDGEIAEVGEERRDLRARALAAACAATSDSSNRSRVPKTTSARIGKRDAFGHVGFRNRGRREIFGEEAGFFHVRLVPRPRRAAADAEGNGVLVEDVGEALDFAGVGGGEEHASAIGESGFHFFDHRRNRAVEA